MPQNEWLLLLKHQSLPWKRKCSDRQTANNRGVLFHTPVYALLRGVYDFQRSASLSAVAFRGREAAPKLVMYFYHLNTTIWQEATSWKHIRFVHACVWVLCDPPLLSCQSGGAVTIATTWNLSSNESNSSCFEQWHSCVSYRLSAHVMSCTTATVADNTAR